MRFIDLLFRAMSRFGRIEGVVIAVLEVATIGYGKGKADRRPDQAESGRLSKEVPEPA